MSQNWIAHTTAEGEPCAKCSVCGFNVRPERVGTDYECLSCWDIADNARLKAEREATLKRLSEGIEVVDIDVLWNKVFGGRR